MFKSCFIMLLCHCVVGFCNCYFIVMLCYYCVVVLYVWHCAVVVLLCYICCCVTGVVFSYTESGVQRQQQSWEKSLTIPLVTTINQPSHTLVIPSNHPSPAVVTPSIHSSPPLLPGSIVRSWDRRLETFASQDRWTTDRSGNCLTTAV